MNNNSQVCAIKPFTGKVSINGSLISVINDLRIPFKYNPFSSKTYNEQLIEYFQSNVDYVYGTDAMMVNLQSRLWTFLGENPMNMLAGTPWKNLIGQNFYSAQALRDILIKMIQNAVNDVNNLLSESQLIYAALYDGNLTVVDQNIVDRTLTIGVTIYFTQKTVSKTLSLGFGLGETHSNGKTLYNIIRRAA